MLQFYGPISCSSHLLLLLYTTMKSTIFYSFTNGMHSIKQSRNTAILRGITLLPLQDSQSTTIAMVFYPVLRLLLGWLYAIIAVSSSSTPDPILKAQAKGSIGAFSAKTMQIAVGAIAEPIHIEIRISYSCKVYDKLRDWLADTLMFNFEKYHKSLY